MRNLLCVPTLTDSVYSYFPELNDWYTQWDEWPVHAEYANLSSYGYSYRRLWILFVYSRVLMIMIVPYILSAWAIFHNYEPVNRLHMDNDDRD